MSRPLAVLRRPAVSAARTARGSVSPLAGALLLAALFAVGISVPASVVAQEVAEGGPEAGFIDRMDVLVVNLDVTVLDEDGNTVEGLRAEDFEVYEDDRRLGLTNFFEVRSGRRMPDVMPEIGSEEARLLLQPIEQRAEPLHLVLYVDNFNLSPLNRRRTLHHVRQFLLSQLQSGDRVALYAYDRPLRQLVPFTEDIGEVLSALDGVERTSAFRSSMEDDRQQLLSAIYSEPPPQGVDVRMRFYARKVQNDLAFTINGIRNLCDSISGLPGRKAVLYVSDGLPWRGAEDVFQARAETTGESSYLMDVTEYDFSREFTLLAAKVNTNDVNLFTIDAAGLRGYELGSARASGSRSHVAADFTHRRNMQSTLEFMADETGGLAVVGTNNIGDGLRRFADALDNYYSLGYTPAHGRDGRYYSIEVKVVGRDDLKVRHRQGYRFKSLETEFSDRTMAALLHGIESNSHGAFLEFGRPTPADDKKLLVPVLVRVPSESLTLLPRGDDLMATLRVFVAAIDEEQRLAPAQSLLWTIRFPAARAAEAEGIAFTYELKMIMRPGVQTVAVGLAEDATGLASYVKRSIRLAGSDLDTDLDRDLGSEFRRNLGSSSAIR
ncbi:MAG: VWA domain-containing protein [Acidobacteriota bacterium]